MLNNFVSGPVDFWNTITRKNGNFMDNLDGTNAGKGAQEAAAIQTAYGEKAIDKIGEARDRNVVALDPYVQGGKQDYINLRGMQGRGEFNSPDFKYQGGPEFNAPADTYTDPGFSLKDVMNDPGYKFRLNQGINAVQNSAAARHSLHSGNTLTGINDYAQGFASNEANNAYARYAADRAAGTAHNIDARNFAWDTFNNNRNFAYGSQMDTYNSGVNSKQARFNRLSQLAGYGPQATSSLIGINTEYGNNVGNLLTGIGNVQAAGITGNANAKTQGTQNLLNFGGAVAGKAAGAFSGGMF